MWTWWCDVAIFFKGRFHQFYTRTWSFSTRGVCGWCGSQCFLCSGAEVVRYLLCKCKSTSHTLPPELSLSFCWLCCSFRALRPVWWPADTRPAPPPSCLLQPDSASCTQMSQSSFCFSSLSHFRLTSLQLLIQILNMSNKELCGVLFVLFFSFPSKFKKLLVHLKERGWGQSRRWQKLLSPVEHLNRLKSLIAPLILWLLDITLCILAKNTLKKVEWSVSRE